MNPLTYNLEILEHETSNYWKMAFHKSFTNFYLISST